MTFPRTLLFLALLLGTAAAQAQDWESYGLKVCNKGDLRFSVAIVSKVPGTLSDDWSVYGWIPIKPKQCEQVYHQRAWESGFTIHHPVIHVAFAFTDSTGAWGPVTLAFPRESTYRFCGTREEFRYNHQPAVSCIGSQFWIPASVDYDPAPRYSVDSWGAPEAFTLNVAMTAKDRVSVVVQEGSGVGPSSGPSKGSSDSSSVTAKEVLDGLAAAANLGGLIARELDTPPKPFDPGTLNAKLLGNRIVRRSSNGADWYYEKGSRVNPVYELKGKTRSYLLDAPTQHAATDPEVAAAQQALQRALGSFPWTRESMILPEGRLFYGYYAGKNNAGKDFESKVIVNVATLDFARAKRFPPTDGLSRFEIPCKGDEPCAVKLDKDDAGGLSNNRIAYSVTMYFIGDSSGQAVWDALLRLRALYPAEPSVAAR